MGCKKISPGVHSDKGGVHFSEGRVQKAPPGVQNPEVGCISINILVISHNRTPILIEFPIEIGVHYYAENPLFFNGFEHLGTLIKQQTEPVFGSSFQPPKSVSYKNVAGLTSFDLSRKD